MDDLSISKSTVKSLVGPEGWKAFKLFLSAARIAYRSSDFRCRFSCSAVTRGELQLLAVDIPRFVLRARMVGNDSFVNLRRLIEFHERLDGVKWLTSDSPSWERICPAIEALGYSSRNTPRDSPSALFRQYMDCSVADAVIVPAPEIKELFSLVTPELGWPNGEGRSIQGVPFVHAMPHFGGAACAQACAHMVCACSHAWPSTRPHEIPPISYFGMHGLAEVTSIASLDEAHAIPLSGLTIEELQRYFRRIERNVLFQSSIDLTHAQAVEQFVDIARMYVNSGIPLILLCNSDRQSPDSDMPNHAMVVVGVPGRRSGGPKHESRLPADDSAETLKTVETLVLLNDPSGMPLQPAGAEELAMLASFSYQIDDDCDDPGANYCAVSSLVLLPDSVTLPLVEPWSTVSLRPARLGLTSFIEAIVEKADDASPAEFHLALVEPGSGNDVASLSKRALDFVGVDFARVFAGEKNVASLRSRWVWIERRESVIRFWLADAAPLSSTAGRTILARRAHAESLLVLNAEKIAGSWKVRRLKARVEARSSGRTPMTPSFGRGKLPKVITATAVLEPKAAKRLTTANDIASKPVRYGQSLPAALITSISASSLTEAASVWPKGIAYGDLYAFMHRDEATLGSLWRTLGVDRKKPPAVVDLLARAERELGDRREKSAHLIAQSIAEVFGRLQGFKGFRAMSTYLPQLFSSEQDIRRTACLAISFLQRIAAALDKTFCREPLRVIEIVSGSRIGGIAVGSRISRESEDGRRYFAFREAADLRISFLVQCLAELNSIRKDAVKDLPTVAAEIEPGHLFSLSNADSLAAFCKNLKSAHGPIGINVDIGHCVLAGITPEQVFDNETVAKRISGFHFSDQGPGHLSDLVPSDCCFNAVAERDVQGRLCAFVPWLRRAAAFAANRNASESPVAFSGVVSIELEAVRSRLDLQYAADAVNWMLRAV